MSLKLHCPYCQGRQLQVATSTQFSTYTNVTRKQVTTTVLSKNTRYWCCQDCGNTFPFPQDLQAQAESHERDAATLKNIAIFEAIAGTAGLLLGAIPGLGGIMVTLSVICYLLAAVFAFWLSPSSLRDAEKLHADYAALVAACMEYDAVSENQ